MDVQGETEVSVNDTRRQLVEMHPTESLFQGRRLKVQPSPRGGDWVRVLPQRLVQRWINEDEARLLPSMKAVERFEEGTCEGHICRLQRKVDKFQEEVTRLKISFLKRESKPEEAQG